MNIMTDCKHIISFDDLTQILEYGQANSPYIKETELVSNGDGWAVRVPCAKCHEEFDVDLVIHPESKRYYSVLEDIEDEESLINA